MKVQIVPSHGWVNWITLLRHSSTSAPCADALYCAHAPHCDAFCCIVEHSGCRILQHCQQIEGDSSIGQGGSLDIKALVALSSHIALPGHLLGWQQEAQVFLMCIRLSLLLLELDQEDISLGALNP